MVRELGVGAVNRHGALVGGERDHGPLFSHEIIAASRGRAVIAAAARLMREMGFL